MTRCRVGGAVRVDVVRAEAQLGRAVSHVEAHLHRAQRVGVGVVLRAGVVGIGQVLLLVGRSGLVELLGGLCVLRQVDGVFFLSAEHLHVVVGEEALCGEAVAGPLILHHDVGREHVDAAGQSGERLREFYLGNVAIPDAPEVGSLDILHGDGIALIVVDAGEADVVAVVDAAPSE